MKQKREFKVGDEISFDEANTLKSEYYMKYEEIAFKGEGKGLKHYESLKNNFKKKCKFKIIELPEV